MCMSCMRACMYADGRQHAGHAKPAHACGMRSRSCSHKPMVTHTYVGILAYVYEHSRRSSSEMSII